MTMALATKPATALRTLTKPVRKHAAAMERARDRYIAGLKRLEADYFETIRRITDTLTQDGTESETERAAEPGPVAD
jgi:hypothetical protein